MTKTTIVTFLCAAVLAVNSAWGAGASITYPAKAGAGQGKHIVFLSGDEEYRSEEGLPMLAKILSQRHGFKCTVLFSLDDEGNIHPDKGGSLGDSAALDSADAIVMLLRFRHWPDDAMKRFEKAFLAGKPIIALRTSTHAFNFGKDSAWAKYSYNSGAPWKGGFGKQVLGETWVSHWGNHKREATLGVIEPGAQNDPILRGVGEIFGDSDVYEAAPPADAKILVRGQVLKGMKATDAPADYKKKRADKVEQGVNDPMMPVVWTRLYKNEAGNDNKILCTTLGAATDLQSEGLRRLLVNSVYWGVGLEVPAKADVAYVDDFKPLMYGFGSARIGIKPSDHALGVVLPMGLSAKPKPAEAKPAAKPQAAAPTLQLNRGDHIAIIGNTLADRMQHSGHFETMLHAQFPEHNLVVRNLAAAGDEVVKRHRSENFGTPDDWLTKVQADVIFAFFGFNESFAGYDGIAKFKADLGKFLQDTAAKNYSGKGSPRIVLFSPIANEKHQDPNFPDPAVNNANLGDYTAAMEEVAKASGVQFVNLFTPSKQIYEAGAKLKQSSTVNGIHLTEGGDQRLAAFMFKSLLGQSAPTGDHAKLRAAVNEKNWQWHQRYRTVDGYNVYGGRSRLSFPKAGKDSPKITNYEVMQEEMSQRDVLTANRDKRVWAVAKGGDLKVDDSNLPKVTQIKSNKPGSNPDESYPFVGGEAAIAKMKVHSGMKVNLFADEKQFPELANPVQMAWDTKGRLWVAAWPSYPERTPTSTVGDKLLVFEDTNRDGKADKVTTFLDDLNCPTGFQFYKDGVLVMQAPDLWFVRDTDGDGKADWKERVLMGLDSADSHHTANAICLDPGGAIYLSDGVFHRTQVETAVGPLRNNDGAIYRFEPRTGKFETYISYGFANPHGRVFDRWGNDFVTDATGNNTYFGAAISGYLDYPAKHAGVKQFWERPSRPCPGTGIITSRHFPEEFQDNFLNINVIGFQGIYRVKVNEQGSGLEGKTLENLIESSEPNFRPICVSMGPEGAIYFCDWHKPLIGHMQHHIRDPNRDHEHGRIYRITYEGRPLMEPAKIDGQSIPKLLDLLKEPENQTRELAKIELGKHDSAKVIAATTKWMNSLKKSDPNYEHEMMEALWVHQWHNVVDATLLKRMLKSPEPRARAAAARVLCYWRDRVSDSLPLFASLAVDEHPRVRLEAVRAASFYRTADATDVALAVLKQPTDYYLDYTLKETLRQLEPLWRKAIADGQSLASDNPAGLKLLVKNVSTTDLMKLARTPAVHQAILSRADVLDFDRIQALDVMAKEHKSSRLTELLNTLDATKSNDPGLTANLARLLPQQAAADLKSARSRVAKFTAASHAAELRQAAWAALAFGDSSFDSVWADASKSPASLTDLLAGIPLLFDPEFRGQAYDRVKPLLSAQPAAQSASRTTSGRYVRIELPRTGTLTLAEVEVFSDGKNIAPQGKAKQSTTANSAGAERAIDGKTDSAFASGTQTHTQEDKKNPWWEVDLGGERPIESVVVWNRADGLSKRLDGFTLTVLDGQRGEVFSKKDIAAPATSARLAIGGADPVRALRRAAIRALVAMPRDQELTFAALSGLLGQGEQVTDAAQGLRTLPRASWPKGPSATAANALLAWAKTIPASERTGQDFIEVVQVASDLAGALPADKATALRKELRSLSVAVFVIKTVREQMRYDTPRLVVEAGKPFEVIIENDDFMPHNLVFVLPGTREKIGNLAALMKPDELDGRGRAFVPTTPDVLSATKLLEAGQKVTLSLTAPNNEGTYEYVCTFPGHWQLMWGQLIVTKDVDAYLQANPVAQLPAATGQNGHDEHGK